MTPFEEAFNDFIESLKSKLPTARLAETLDQVIGQLEDGLARLKELRAKLDEYIG